MTIRNIYPTHLVPNAQRATQTPIRIGDRVTLVLADGQRPVTSTVEMVLDLFGTTTYTSRANAVSGQRFRFRPQDVHHVETRQRAA